jgi:hypothetical protein
VAQTTVTHVALVNHSTVVHGTDVTLLADALTQQVEHLAQAGYDIYADVLHYAPGHEPLDAWRLYIVDDTDQADALGYHETTPTGQPVGYTFARTVTDAGLSWTVTSSHELVEMLIDPTATLGVDLGNGTWVAWEGCDPVEADAYGYKIDGIAVSDFITPAWFDRNAKGPYDWTRRCHRPLTLLPGGYVAVQRHGQWIQQTHRQPSPDGVSRVEFARRINRRIGRTEAALIDVD